MSTMRKILVVEDEPTCQILLTQALAFKFNIELSTTINRAKDFLQSERPDLILLDFYLPDGDAFDLIQHVKNLENGNSIPIILLTQASETKIKVRSFSEGVYDFITKPFDPAELVARIQSHLLRSDEIKSIYGSTQQVGDLELDIEAKKITLKIAGQFSELSLSPIEYKILQCLIQNAGKVRTREQIAVAAWRRQFFQSRTIDRHISSIRKKLGPRAGYLQTVSQGGYRLTNNESEASV